MQSSSGSTHKHRHWRKWGIQTSTYTRIFLKIFKTQYIMKISDIPKPGLVRGKGKLIVWGENPERIAEELDHKRSRRTNSMIYPFGILLLSVCHPFAILSRFLERRILGNYVLISSDVCVFYMPSIIDKIYEMIMKYQFFCSLDKLVSACYPSAILLPSFLGCPL